MTPNQTQKPTAAVYVSWATFKNALDQLSKGELPNLIDKTVFTGMSWSVQNQLFTALKFLGLTDDKGAPSPDLESLVRPNEVDRKIKLKEILHAKYPELFSLNLKKTTPGELEKKMSEVYGMAGDTRDKGIRFFLSAADYVGIEVSSLFNIGKKTGTGANGNRKRAPRRKSQNAQPPHSAPAATGGTSKVVTLKSGGTLTLSATLDLFSLNTADRKFVFELIDKMEGYEQPQPASTEGASLS